jgi:large subunit ribosomal protein L18
MVKQYDRNAARKKRQKRVRGKISGTAECPRLNVFRSANHIYAQLIDDSKGITIAQASTLDKGFEGPGGNIAAAEKIGETVAQRAKEKGIEKVVFDRAGFLYHGRVAALADAARKNGLVF